MVSSQLIDTGDIDTLSMNDIIGSKIDDAARYVLLNAPLHLLDVGSNFGDTLYWEKTAGIGSGYVLLPNDYLRLLVFQMTDWERPVYAVTTPAAPAYNMQYS